MTKSAQCPPDRMPALSPWVMAELFEQVPEVAFFIKDAAGRYTAVNASLLRRTGLRHRASLLGKTVEEVFPPDLAARYRSQDAEVLRTGRAVRDQLELHWYADQHRGWCLTTKLPLRDPDGTITGLAGISRDVPAPAEAAAVPAGLKTALAWLQEHFSGSCTATALAHQAGMPPARFARLTKRLFGLSPQQMIAQTRLQAATALLEQSRTSIAEIAVRCGFADHSAFTRAFKEAVGLTPTRHRESCRNRESHWKILTEHPAQEGISFH